MGRNIIAAALALTLIVSFQSLCRAGGNPAAPLGEFRGPAPIAPAGRLNVPFIRPKPIWNNFLIMVWPYKTSVRKDIAIYERLGFRGLQIDRGAEKADTVEFARKRKMPYYVGHVAGKGYLYLTDRTGRKRILRKRNVVPRPNSLVDPATIAAMRSLLRRNISVTRRGPVLAYAFDDEISLGVFTSPCEVDGSRRSVAGFRRYLRQTYGSIDRLNRTWGTKLASFAQVRPTSFEQVRKAHTRPPLALWNLSRWMDWRSYMDSQFAECLADLTRYANSLDPATPAGFVGGQQPAPYGGYDYDKLCRAVQWIESYDIGGTCEILRSLWCAPQRRPYVQTWFSTGDTRRDRWFLWYYLLHGNRGVIAWPDRNGSWFHYKGRGVAPFIAANADTFREIQGPISKYILDPDTRFEPDPIAVLYSHPSVQAGWAMDVVTHRGTWPNRLSSMDNACQTAGKNRVAWFKLLEDCFYQYNVVTSSQVAAGELVRRGYRVLILDRSIALSDAEAEAIRDFVRRGGTVIADYLAGVLDEHGKGRPAGALDGLFGIKRDESKGYLDGKGITEIDGERYRRPFLERLRYAGTVKYDGIVVYERGTRADGAKAGASAGGADVLITKRTGRGRTVYLNLTPVAYYDNNMRIGPYGRRWRRIVGGILADAGLQPRAKVVSNGKLVPLAELVYWRKGDRLVVGLVKNPSRQGALSGPGTVYGVAGKPIDVEIVFPRRLKFVRDLRTGKSLPAGTTIRAKFDPSEALLYAIPAR